MSYVQVESSVARHPKFIKAGPAPSWLWLCGLAYCQEGLTDGFIPTSALEYLGVKNARQLATRLVEATLWETTAGGWMVHDYLKHNKPAAEVQSLRARRAAGGNLGGRPKVNHQGSQTETLKANHPVNPSHLFTSTATPRLDTATTNGSKVRPDGPPFGTWLSDLQARYPERARSGGYRTETAFLGVFQRHPQTEASLLFAAMLDNLETQIGGEQWRSGKVPNLARWLSEDLWTQRHEPARTSRLTSDVPPEHEWDCPHVERCGAPSTCDRLIALDPQGTRYPRKPLPPPEGAPA